MFNAALGGKVEAVSLLLERGADPLLDHDGAAPLTAAMRRISSTWEREENGEDCKYAEYSKGHHEVTRLLLRNTWPTPIVEAAFSTLRSLERETAGSDWTTGYRTVTDAIAESDAALKSQYPEIYERLQTPAPAPHATAVELKQKPKKFKWLRKLASR